MEQADRTPDILEQVAEVAEDAATNHAVAQARRDARIYVAFYKAIADKGVTQDMMLWMMQDYADRKFCHASFAPEQWDLGGDDDDDGEVEV